MRTEVNTILPIFGTSLSDEDSYPDIARAQAEIRAKEKLARIIEREGDLNGARRQPQYLEQLIQEALRERRFARFTVELDHIRRYNEIKEKPAAVAAGQF